MHYPIKKINYLINNFFNNTVKYFMKEFLKINIHLTNFSLTFKFLL